MFQYRSETVVPQRMAEVERVIEKQDFKTFARLTMQAGKLAAHKLKCPECKVSSFQGLLSKVHLWFRIEGTIL